MTRFCVPRSVSRKAVHPSLFEDAVRIPSPAESSPARKLATLASVPAGICINPAACRRSLMGSRVDHIKLRLMQPHIISNLPGQQRMLLCRIVSNQQNGRCSEYFSHTGGQIVFCRAKPQPEQGSRRCGDGRRYSSSAPLARIWIAGNLLRWWCESNPQRRSRTSAVAVTNFRQTFGADQSKRLLPGGGSQACRSPCESAAAFSRCS
jgi:hypothetical protein